MKPADFILWALARAEEPSTWAGGSGLAMVLSIALPGYADTLLHAGAAFGAFLAVVLPEKKFEQGIKDGSIVDDHHGGYVPATNSRVLPSGELVSPDDPRLHGRAPMQQSPKK